MSANRIYGSGVFVAACLTITGAVWFSASRVNQTPRGEDIAECMAAYNERYYVGYATGTNAVAWPSNTVSSVPLWDMIYRQILCRSRDMLVLPPDGYAVGGFTVSNLSFSGRVFWVDPAYSFHDGGLLASSDSHWAFATNQVVQSDSNNSFSVSYYELSGPSNTASSVPTTGSHALNGQDVCPFIPDGTRFKESEYDAGERIPETNTACVARYVYGPRATNQVETFDYPAWTSGSFWSEIGLGTNSYQYGCERFLYSEIPFDIVQLGDGYVCSNAYSYVKSSSPGPVRVTSVSPPPASVARRVGASAFRMTDVMGLGLSSVFCVGMAGLSGSFSETWAAIPYADSGGGVANAFAIPEGSAYIDTHVQQLGAYPASQKSCALTCYGDAYASTNQLSWLTGNPPLRIFCAENGIGLIRFTTTVAGVQTITDISVCNPSANHLSLDSYSAQIAAAGTHDFRPSINPFPTGCVLTVGMAVSTSHLHAAKAVLQSMTRSVCIASGIPDIGISPWYYNSTNSFDYESGSLRLSPWDSYPPLYRTYTNFFAETSVLADVYVSENYWQKKWIYSQEEGGQTYYDRGAESTISIKLSKNHYFLPYPSKYACESGYVNKVEVYGVFMISPVSALTMGYWFGSDDADVSYSVHPPQDYNSRTLGICSHPCVLPELTVSWTKDSSVDFYAEHSDVDCLSIVLSKIKDFSSGECKNGSNLFFEVGITDCPQIPESFSDISEAEETKHFWNYDYTFARSDLATGWKISMPYYVIVVDWNWKHLNEANPFQPVTWTPEWLSTNTP